MNYEIGGKVLTCSQCGGRDFEHRQTQLNQAWMAFLDFDWFRRGADIYCCMSCGKVEWFLPVGDRVADDASKATDCLLCGSTIPAGTSKCPDCGWSYKE